MNLGFWRDRRVFLTGHTGFKGSWLSLWLQQLGAKLTGYALDPPTSPSLFEVARVAEGMTSIIGDVRNYASLYAALAATKPEIIFHLAAQPLVRYSYEHPVETYAVNVMGTVNLLEAVRTTPGVKAIVNITTDKCYENREWPWGYRETEPMGGHDPYSSSKGCSELVSAAYRASYFSATSLHQYRALLATARAGNVIGGGDWAQDRLLPDVIAAFAACKAVDIRNPNAVRPWQHVLEPLRGYLMLAERLFAQKDDFAEGWNFGPRDEDARSVAWIVSRVAELWKGAATWRVDTAKHPHEAHYLKLDISKACARLNWHPHLSLDEALAMTVEWAKQRQAGADMRDFTHRQIADYLKITTGQS